MRREDATRRAQEQPARPGRVGPSGRVARAPSRCIRTGSPSGVHGARGAARIRPTSSRSTTRPSARGAGCRLTSRLPIAPLPAAKASTCGSRPRRTCAGASREVSLVRAWIHGSDNGSSVNCIGPVFPGVSARSRDYGDVAAPVTDSNRPPAAARDLPPAAAVERLAHAHLPAGSPTAGDGSIRTASFAPRRSCHLLRSCSPTNSKCNYRMFKPAPPTRP